MADNKDCHEWGDAADKFSGFIQYFMQFTHRGSKD